MNSKTVHRYPFLRMLIPLMIGIGGSEGLFFYTSLRLPDLRGFLLLIPVALLLVHLKGPRKRESPLFGVLLTAGAFLTGAVLHTHQLENTERADDHTPQLYTAQITQVPVPKAKTVCCNTRIRRADDDGKEWRALLYLQKDSASMRLKEGDHLAVRTRITAPQANGTPSEFDYRRYLMHKQIAGTGYVAASQWQHLSPADSTSSRASFISRLRQHTWDIYHREGFGESNYAVLTALTTGYKEELTDELTQTYSLSGASHLLAVSGLHVGLIYALATFLLNLIGFVRRNRWIRTLLILAILIVFALFTGLSPSVVRAVVMAGLFLVADTLQRNQRPGNSLLIAAFFMLLFRPSWLFEVGFQLSFCAVAGILYFAPRLQKLLQPTHAATRYIWQLSCVSVAAQIGTLPLVCHYFGQMPLYFLLTNLVAIPLTTLILYTAIALLVCAPLPWVPHMLARWADTLLTLQNNFLHWVGHLPGAVSGQFHPYATDLAAYFIVGALLMQFWNRRTCRNYCVLGMVCTAFIGLHLLQRYHDRPHTSIALYNLQGTQAVQCIEQDGASWMVYPSGTTDSLRTTRQLSRHWRRHSLHPQHVAGSYQENHLHVEQNLLSFHHTTLLRIDRPVGQIRPSEPIQVDYLYLSKGYAGTLEELQSAFRFREIIVDRSVKRKKTKRLLHECRQKDVKITDLASKGYRLIRI